jgi:uncharacterized protein
LLKAVIDTNIWLSALIGTGPPRKIKDCLQARLFQVIYAQELFDELVDVLSRPKYATKLPPAEVYKLIQLIEEVAIMVKLDQVPTVSRDPKDDMFLACAAVSDSDYLVSGDSDLLDLLTHGRTKIVRAAEFISILEEQKS